MRVKSQISMGQQRQQIVVSALREHSRQEGLLLHAIRVYATRDLSLTYSVQFQLQTVLSVLRDLGQQEGHN